MWRLNEFYRRRIIFASVGEDQTSLIANICLIL
jgi:hypothetical protein